MTDGPRTLMMVSEDASDRGLGVVGMTNEGHRARVAKGALRQPQVKDHSSRLFSAPSVRSLAAHFPSQSKKIMRGMDAERDTHVQ